MKPILLGLRDAVAFLRDQVGPGGRIHAAGCAAEPVGLLRAAAADADIWDGLTLTGAFIPGVNEWVPEPGWRIETIFTTEAMRRGTARIAHLPMHYSAYWSHLCRAGAVGAVVTTVPQPAPDGTVGLGIACDFVPASIAAGAVVVAVINPNMPDMRHGPRLPLSRVAVVVEDDHPLPALRVAPPDPTSRAIAGHVLNRLPDGATLQLGLGKLQGALLDLLARGAPSGLGYHAGMIQPGVLQGDLFPRGITTGVALGDAAFYGDRGLSDRVRFAPVGHTHAHSVLAGLQRLTSVNSALAVDLSGQVNAEYLGRQTSGQGGMVDFIRGARASDGGRSIIALPATARGGAESRIVAAFPAGTPISVARADVDMIATEYGIADLRDADLAERARRLAAIAAPAFRDALLARGGLL